MLHHPDSLYLGDRVDSLIKLKAFQEIDVSVVDMNPGQGRLSGMMGSLQVRMMDGTVFNVALVLPINSATIHLRKGKPLLCVITVSQRKGSHVLPALYEKKPRSRRDLVRE